MLSARTDSKVEFSVIVATVEAADINFPPFNGDSATKDTVLTIRTLQREREGGRERGEGRGRGRGRGGEKREKRERERGREGEERESGRGETLFSSGRISTANLVPGFPVIVVTVSAHPWEDGREVEGHYRPFIVRSRVKLHSVQAEGVGGYVVRN